jgi:uncharacterized protein YlzI (FlbEa/FlbD family)
MKTINVLVKSQGHSMMELQTQFWQELITIDNGTLEETPNSYTINLTNGKKLFVDKNKVKSEDEHRIIYVGSMKEICDIPFLFTKMKSTGMHELWHSHFTPGQGGFSILCSVD